MSLSILQSTHAICPGQNTTPFGASGGVAPYTYSVSGAGGTINSSTGVYTSPLSSTGVETISVSDSSMSPQTATTTLLVDYPILLVADIIKTAMGLAGDQVYLYNQKFNVPSDSRLYIAIGVLNSRPFANQPKYDGSGGGLSAVQSVNVNDTLSINILSRSTEALLRKEEVLMALSSPYAQQQMNLNAFYVAALTTTLANLGMIEGAAIPYRFNFSVNLQYFRKLTTDVGYFDTFEDVVVTPEP